MEGVACKEMRRVSRSLADCWEEETKPFKDGMYLVDARPPGRRGRMEADA